MSLAAASAADEKNSFVVVVGGGVDDCGGGEVARRTDGLTVVVQRRDSKTRGQCRVHTGRESWEQGRVECHSITSQLKYAIQVETDLTLR